MGPAGKIKVVFHLSDPPVELSVDSVIISKQNGCKNKQEHTGSNQGAGITEHIHLLQTPVLKADPTTRSSEGLVNKPLLKQLSALCLYTHS